MPYHPNNNDRCREGSERLKSFVEALLGSRGMEALPAPHMDELISEHDVPESARCCFNVDIEDDRVCLIVVAQAAWRNKETIGRFAAACNQARKLGWRALLVPEALLRRGASSAADCEMDREGTHIGGADRISVMSYLLKNASAKISDVAGHMAHPTPIAALLELDLAGAIEIEMAPALHASRVSLPRVGV